MSGLIARITPGPLKRVVHRLRVVVRARRRDLADWLARVNEEPVFILGNQKSGTSIIAALLAELGGRSVAIDLDREVTRPTFHRVRTGALNLDDFIRRNRLEFSRDVVKEANLTTMYPALRGRFPRARFAFVQRDPRDNIRSILQRLGLPGRPAEAGEEQLAGISEAWRLVLDGRWLGLDGADYLAMLAARWQHFADLAAGAGEKMTVIRYEDFRADKVGGIRELARHLGIAEVADISASTERQYQPRGDHSVGLREFFGEEGLRLIERICARGMATFGYEAKT